VLRTILKRAGADTFRYFPVRLVPALTSLVTVPVFTRLISSEEYGDFALITSAVSLIAVIATQWINGSIVRLYWTYEKEERHDEYVSTAVWSTTSSLAIASMVAAVALLLLRDSLSPGLLRLAPIALASLAFNNLSSSVLQILRAANKATKFSTLSVAKTIIGTAFSVWFVAVPKMGAFGIMLGMVIGNLLVLPLTLLTVRAQGRLAPRFFRRDIGIEFMRYGFPFVPAAISAWILVLADRYVIGALRGSAEVGLYSVTYGLGEKIMQLIMLPILTAIAPILVQTFEKQGQELTQRAQTHLTRYFAMATFPLLLGMAAVSRHFIETFTGAEYHEAYPILAIVAAGVMLYGFVQIAANGITLYRKSAIIMTNVMAAAVFNVGANLLLVGRFGYVAAAYTTIASYLLLLGLTWWRGRHYMAWKPPWIELARILTAAFVMAAVLVAGFGRFDPGIWVLLAEVIVGISVYGSALWLLRGFHPDELALVRDLFGRVMRRIGLKRG